MQNDTSLATIYRWVFIYGWIVVRVVLLDALAFLLPPLVYFKLRLKLSHESIIALVLDPTTPTKLREDSLEMFWKQAESLSDKIRALEAHTKG